MVESGGKYVTGT